MSADYEVPAEIDELLAAIVEALDAPWPADFSEHGVRAHRDLLAWRASLVRMQVQRIRDRASSPGIGWEAAFLRGQVAETPVTYTPQDTAVRTSEGGA